MASYYYPNAPPPQHHNNFSARNASPDAYAQRQNAPGCANIRSSTPVAAPLNQNPPYHPLTQQHSPSEPIYTQTQYLTPHAPILQSYQQVAIIPRENQMTYLAPSSPQQVVPRSPIQYVGTPPGQSDNHRGNARDPYSTAHVSSHDRGRSSSTARSHHSYRSSYNSDESSDDDAREGNVSRNGHRNKKHKKMSRKEIDALERRPSYGDTVKLVWDVVKDTVTGPGRRE